MNTLNSLFDWVLVAGLRASLLVIAVLAAQWLLKNRLPSRWRYALWLPVLGALLVPALPLLPSWMNWPAARAQAEISEKATSPAPASSALTADATLPPFAESADVPAMPPSILEATSTIKTAAAQALRATAPGATPVNWRAWLMAAWFIGAAGVSLFVVVSFALTMRRIRRAALPVKAESLAHIAETAQAVGLRRVPRVLKSSAVASPAVCGLWHPTLLLNERFPQDLSADEADMVLRHELTHIRRGDLALNVLLCALLALHWWNPLLWLAFFRVRADREAACDAQVLDGEPAARRAAYGHTLLKMETEFPPTGLCIGFVGILQRGGTLRERIHAIISQPELNQTMKITIALSIVALTIVGIAKAAQGKPEKAKEETRAAAAKPKKADAAALFDPIVKKFFSEVSPDYANDAKFTVTEYEIEWLWDVLGIQLFKLDCGPGNRVEVFAYAEGRVEHLKLDSFASSGVEAAALFSGSLYFTHSAGSGIGRTILVEVGRGKDNTLTQAVLGSIQSNPPGNENKEIVKKMGDVISKLSPVKQGASTKPAKAAGAEAAAAKDGDNGAKAQPVDLEKVKDEVSVKLGEDTVVNLRSDGERLVPRAPGEKGDAKDVAVKTTLKETTATPFPVQGDPTRSYLSMSNGSEKPLRFRTLARLKGSKEFYEEEGPSEPVEPGGMSAVKCWESGSLVEEVILYQFTLTPEAPDTAGKAEATPTVDGAQAERVATITKQLSKAGKLPGPLLDAQFVEEQTGDGILGPSDFAAFYALTVAPADLPAWRIALSNPKATWNHFANDSEIKRAAPKKAQAWWVKQSDLGALEFYSPMTLTGRANGWIGIAPDGRIFIYAFTM